jgi:TP901 family phage tail tape measure protein
MNAVGGQMKAVGGSMFRYVTLPVAAASVVSMKFASDFQGEMRKVQTQAGGSAKDVAVLSDRILKLKGAQQGPVELAKAMYHLKSVGMDNASAMRALAMASKGAAVGGSDLEETASALAAAWRTGIKGATSFAQSMGTTNAIVGAGNMRMEDMVGALSTGILPVAKAVGLTFTDVGAALATMTDQGVPAQAAATRLRMTFSLMASPSDKAAKALKGIGLGALDLAKTMRAKGLVPAIGLLKEHLSKLSKVKQAQVLTQIFGGGKSSSTMITLLQSLGVVGDKFKQITKTAGGFGKAAALQAKGAGAQWARFKSQMQSTAVVVGQVLLPYGMKLLARVQQLGSAFNRLSPHAKNVVIAVALIAAALGPLLIVTGSVIQKLAIMREAWLAWKAAQIAGGGAGTLASLLTSPFTIWVVAIAAAVVALVLLYAKCAWFRRAVQGVFGALRSTVVAVFEALKATFRTFSAVIGAVVGFIRRHWRGLLDAFLLAMGPVGLVVMYIVHHMDRVKAAVGAVAKAAWAVWSWCWNHVLKYTPLGRIVSLVIDNFGKIKKGVRTAVNAVRGAVGAAWDWIRDHTGAVWNGIVRTVATVVNAIGGFINKAFGWAGVHVPTVSMGGVAAGGSKATENASSAPRSGQHVGDGPGINPYSASTRRMGGLGDTLKDMGSFTLHPHWPKLPSLPGPLKVVPGALMRILKAKVAGLVKKAASAFGGGGSYGWASALAKRFGLSVTSTFRPGAITASGNQSLHGIMGAAADIAGPDSLMNKLWSFVVSTAPAWREAIHEHAMVKNGRLSYYAPNDHFDHVHVSPMRRGDGPSGGAAGGGVSITLRGPFVGAPPEHWSDFVRAHVEDLMEMGFDAVQLDGIARTRESARAY